MVNWKNYEEYMLMHVDGELNEEEQQHLLAFIAEHPGLQEELAAYEATRILPDTALVFAGKESLLKPAQPSRVISLTAFIRYGAAAAVIFLALFAASRFINRGSQDEVRTPEVSATQPVAPTVPAPAKEVAATESAPVAAAPVAVPATPLAVSPIANVESPAMQKEELSEIPARTPSLIPADVERESLRETVAIADVSLPAIDPQPVVQQDRQFLAWLPVNEEKKAGLRSLKDNVDSRIAEVKNIKSNITESAFALRLGDKELVINF